MMAPPIMIFAWPTIPLSFELLWEAKSDFRHFIFDA